ncbi:DUF4158 domain-containing protein [Nonomuraea sp. NPDC050691]|uniref:DUF4158 domain-containing protein n=1 Tax=Nonomuraea sp. NPDC050691 TaxID=3155661 RepID=UPI0033D22BBD
MFSEDQLERLRSYPDIGRDDLIRYFTLTPAGVAFIDPGHGRGPADRLGLAVQLATLPWLGFVPAADVEGVDESRGVTCATAPSAGGTGSSHLTGTSQNPRLAAYPLTP